MARFRGEITPEINQLLQFLGTLATEERGKKRALANLQALTKGGGAFGTDVAPTGAERFRRQPISPFETGAISLETGLPSTITQRTPEDIAGLQEKQDVRRLTAARKELGTTPRGRFTVPQLRGAGKPTAKPFLKGRLRERGAAREAVKELRPPKGEKGFIDENLTSNVISRIGTNEKQLKLFIDNTTKFEKAGVDTNRVFNALFSEAKAKKKSGFLKLLKEVFLGR